MFSELRIVTFDSKRDNWFCRHYNQHVVNNSTLLGH